ncbi:MAG: hypothetical protein IPJ65_10150 [Archangiaceae bacterium]|nr:hypothetical protein [Archangiaceae bacterium]
MTSAIDEKLRTRIAEATTALTAAQRELEQAMRHLIADVPRAQKTIVSEMVGTAFEKVSSTKATLELLLTESSD